MGWRFTFKTVLAVALVSTLTEFIPYWVDIRSVEPWFAALGGGLMVGIGLLIVFRHKASLGGFNVLALYLHERYKIPVGKSQMALDVSIVVAGLWIVPPAASRQYIYPRRCSAKFCFGSQPQAGSLHRFLI